MNRILLMGWMVLFLSVAVPSLYAQTQSFVGCHGQLKVSGNRIVDASGQVITLRGMSMYPWASQGLQYYNSTAVSRLVNEWKCTALRIPILPGSVSTQESLVRTVVDACIANGIYAIIDWHSMGGANAANCAAFMTRMANSYGSSPNVMYELWNEPVTETWSTIKAYHEQVIAAIRPIDPNKIIFCSDPQWDQNPQQAAADPITTSKNIVYVVHFYAASHGQWLINNVASALSQGAAVFSTEYGTCEASGSGTFDPTETQVWWNFLNTNGVGHTNWSVAALSETSAVFNPGTSATAWTDSDLKPSGVLVKNYLIQQNSSLFGTCNSTPVPTSTFTRTPTPVVSSTWRVNAGGPAYTDGTGNLWSADGNFTGGTPATVTSAINGTTEDVLYQTERYGNPFTYTFAVPAGNYQVTLKFAETYTGITAAGQRVFNVFINGTQVLTNFDIFAQVGANTALDETFNNIAPNGSGQIVIQLGPATANNAKVDAIQIIPMPLTQTPSPTAMASSTSTRTSTLTWTASSSPTMTRTNTPVPPTSTASATPSRTNTPTFTSTGTATNTLTATRTNTAVPPTATNTAVPPTATPSNTATRTNTSVPPTATNTNSPVPPSATPTMTSVPPTATDTSVSPTATSTLTPVPPTATNSPVPPTMTNTSVPPTATNSPLPPTATNTAEPPTATFTFTSTKTDTPVPPTSTPTAVPPTATFSSTATRTNTAVPPTNTSTPVPPTATFTPTVPVSTNFKVQLLSGVTSDSTNSPHPQVQIVNTGASPLNLNNVTLRYWFNCDCTGQTLQAWVDWAGLMPSGTGATANVHVSVQPTSLGGQTDFVLYTFTGNMVLQPGQMIQVQSRFNKSDWSNMLQDNDWSFASYTGFTDWTHVTGYLSGTLVWGQEPSSTSSALIASNVLPYPNPSTGTGVSLEVTLAGDASGVKTDPNAQILLKVYTLAHRLIWSASVPSLVFGSSGSHVFHWNERDLMGGNLANGVYLVTATVKSQGKSSMTTNRLLILR